MITPQILPDIDASSHVTADSANQVPPSATSTTEATTVIQEIESKPPVSVDVRTQEETVDPSEKSEDRGIDNEPLSAISEKIEGLKMDDSISASAAQQQGVSGDRDGERGEDVVDRGEEDVDVGAQPHPSEAEGAAAEARLEDGAGLEGEVQVQLLDPEQGSLYLAQVLLEVFNR